MNGSFRLFLLNTLMPITKEVGKVHSPWTVKDVTETDVYSCMKVMKPGMVFATRTDGAMSDLLIPGWWKHNAMVVDEHHVVEAIGVGVCKTGIFDFLMRKDYAVLLSPKFATPGQMEAAAQWAEAQVGASYDYDFLPVQNYSKGPAPVPVKDRAFYCAKLPWAAYQKVCGPDVPFTTRMTLGVPTVVPQDYVAAVDKWERAWASASAAPSLASQQSPIRA